MPIFRDDRSGNCIKCGIWRLRLQRDHRIPRYKGGTDDPINIQWLCANCHQDKTMLEQSDVHRGKPKTPEHRKKMSEWQIGKVISEETKKKLSDIIKRKFEDPQYRKNHLEGIKKREANRRSKNNANLSLVLKAF